MGSGKGKVQRSLCSSCLILLLASCADYENMKAQDLRTVEEYGAGGIDQSENPRKGSVREAVNVSSNKGYWTHRPGIQEINHPFTTVGYPVLITEYTHNPEFAQSYYNTLLLAQVTYLGQHQFKEVPNSETITSITPASGVPTTGSYQTRWSDVKGLWRDTSAVEPRFYYVPCVVFTDGENEPLIYHQKDGTPTIQKLDAVDGGDTSLTYRTEPPKAKYYVMHQGKLFAINIDTDPTAFFYTGLYQQAAQVVNVWPASYYGNAGSGKEQTGGISWGGNLAIFKADEIWLVTGDGDPYAVNKVDSEHGAINQYCIVDVGDSVITLDKNGINRWAGGQAQRISHPRLQHLWKKLDWTESGSRRFQGIYDSPNRQVMFVTGAYPGQPDGYIVYNLDTDTFDYWGAWLDSAKEIIPDRTLIWAAEVKNWASNKNQVLGLYGGYLCAMDGDYYRIGGTTHAIHWYMKTQRYFTSDSQSKLLRQIMVRAKKTGDWQLSVLALVDDEGVVEALARDTATKNNLIMDSANAQEHTVDGTSNFQAVADGPVDVYYLPTMYKLWDSKTLVVASGVDKIKFSAAQDSTGKAGLLLVMEEDKSPVVLFDMYDTGDAIFDDAGTTYDDARFTDPDFEKLISGENAIGRTFGLWISNVGSYNSGTEWAKPGMVLELDGWGLWVRPRGVLRP